MSEWWENDPVVGEAPPPPPVPPPKEIQEGDGGEEWWTADPIAAPPSEMPTNQEGGQGSWRWAVSLAETPEDKQKTLRNLQKDAGMEPDAQWMIYGARPAGERMSKQTQASYYDPGDEGRTALVYTNPETGQKEVFDPDRGGFGDVGGDLAEMAMPVARTAAYGVGAVGGGLMGMNPAAAHLGGVAASQAVKYGAEPVVESMMGVDIPDTRSGGEQFAAGAVDLGMEAGLPLGLGKAAQYAQRLLRAPMRRQAWRPEGFENKPAGEAIRSMAKEEGMSQAEAMAGAAPLVTKSPTVGNWFEALRKYPQAAEIIQTKVEGTLGLIRRSFHRIHSQAGGFSERSQAGAAIQGAERGAAKYAQERAGVTDAPLPGGGITEYVAHRNMKQEALENHVERMIGAETMVDASPVLANINAKIARAKQGGADATLRDVVPDDLLRLKADIERVVTAPPVLSDFQYQRWGRVRNIEDVRRLPNLAGIIPKEEMAKVPWQGKKTVTVWRAVPKNIGEIEPGDWVALTQRYAKTHLQHIEGGSKYHIIKQEVLADDVAWAGTDMNEFFYVPRSQKATAQLPKNVRQTDAAGKPFEGAPRDKLSGQLGFGLLRDYRRRIGPEAGRGVVHGPGDIRQAEQAELYGKLTETLGGAATSKGGNAASAWKSAQKHYSDSQTLLESVRQVASAPTTERAFAAAISGAKDGPSTLKAVKKVVSPEAWDALVSQKLWEMGTSSATTGARGEVGKVFHPTQFIRNWRDMSIQSRDVLFSRGSRVRSALDRLADATASQEQAAQFVNVSQSGVQGMYLEMVGDGMMSQMIGADISAAQARLGLVQKAVGAVTGMGKAQRARRQARLMTDPDFVEWLEKGTRSTSQDPAAVGQHLGKLAGLAASKPELAGDLEWYLDQWRALSEAKPPETLPPGPGAVDTMAVGPGM